MLKWWMFSSGEAQVEVAMGVLCALRVGRGFVSSKRVEVMQQTEGAGAREICWLIRLLFQFRCF
jgi:hypothetical protein